MTKGSVNAEQRLRALSKEKAEILRRLRRRKLREATEISVRGAEQGSPALLPASWAQQRLWFVDQLEGGSAQYNIALALRLRGSLQPEALRKAFDTVVQRHEVLRGVFVAEDGRPRVRILPQTNASLRVDVLKGHGAAELEQQVLRHRRGEVSHKFDLAEGPLIRARLLQLNDQHHVLLITMHHTVTDGWSLNVLIQELSELYTAYTNGRSDPLPPLPIQYADYARWQEQSSQDATVRRQVEYLCKQLAGAPPQLELPTDRPRPAVQSYVGENHNFTLDETLTAKLKALAQRQGMTLFMVLLSGWSMLLARLSNQWDLVIGTAVANRQQAQLEGLIGFFVNTLPLRIQPRRETSVLDVLQQVRALTLAGYDHQGAPFEKVVEALQPERSLSRNPLFQVTFSLHTAPKQAARFAGLTATIEDEVDEPARFDLALSMEPRQQHLFGSVNYAVDLFARRTIERWMNCFSVLLTAMADDPTRRVYELPLLADAQRRRILDSFNPTPVPQPETTIHQQFEWQVSRSPAAPAVIFGEQLLTYAELNSRANQLARHLREAGVGADALVAVCIDRSIEMIVAILGVLKAGGAYVPLDPAYPSQRIAHIIAEAVPQVVITQKQYKPKVRAANVAVLALDETWEQITRHSDANLSPRHSELRSDRLAYVIYTSGSTGAPKGVMIEHQAVMGLWQGLEHHIYSRMGDCRRIGVNASFSFDASVKQLIQLLSGRALVLIPQEMRLDPAHLLRWLEAIHADGIDCTPSQLRSWIAAGLLDPARSYPQVVLIGGEPIDAALWTQLAASTRIHFYNVYGPTECTVDATVARVSAAAAEPHLGHPMQNKRIYVLDDHRQPAPIGVPGELHIGGAGLARGYLHAPALSSSRFVADPFDAATGARMYRTGDLARWREDGTLVYIGRNDDQVKILGHRIELGEIESRLARHPQLKEAVVAACEGPGGVKRLVAYVTKRTTNSLDTAALREHLKSGLPEHMLPSAYVLLDRLPLTPNGKLDRRALPAPDLASLMTRVYEPPRGRIETILSEIWQELLGVDRVGRQDNFFELGGHSLLIVQLMDKLRQHGLTAQLRRVLERPILAEFAAALSAYDKRAAAAVASIPEGCTVITPAMLPLIELNTQELGHIVAAVPGGAENIQDIYPLSPLQEGILFHHLYEKNQGTTYVGNALLAISGRERLERLVEAWQRVIDRHDALRTAVLWERLSQPVQVVQRRATLPVTELQLGADEDPVRRLKDYVAAAEQRIDLKRAPLLRLTVALDERNDRWLAALQMHHLVSDHVSREIVLAEVLAILEGRAAQLQEPQSYRNHMAPAPTAAQLQGVQDYFRERLADVDELTAAFGLLDVHGDGSRIEQVEQPLTPELASRIRKQARRLGVSPATLFHAAWALVVGCTSGKDDVVFGSVLMGRLQGDADTQRAVGLFLNTLPLRVRLDRFTAQSLIAHMRSELVGLLSHEQASLAIAQRCSAIGDGAPLFTALLNFRHNTSPLESTFSDSAGVTFLEQHNRTNYPLLLSVDSANEQFALDVEADRAIDAGRIVRYMETALYSLTEALEHAPHTPALALAVMPSLEREQVLRGFNATASEFTGAKLIHELFEAQAARTPAATALIHDERSLTYAQLNACAEQLAASLLRRGLRSNDLVGICLDRSVEMVVGVIAILKAGGAYVPMDPSYPAERLQYMLEDARPRLLLIQEKYCEQFSAAESAVVVIDRITDELADHPPSDIERAGRVVSSEALLYVIYTSGSTGRPKGTAMPHRSMANLIEWHRAEFAGRNAARTLQFAALSFDVAFQEIFSTLCLGGTLILLDEWVRRDARALTALLEQQAVQRLFVPPLMLQAIAEYAHAIDPPMGPRHLQDVITAGEQLRVSPEITSFFQQRPDCRLHNHYGPTETHVVTALTLSGAPDRWPSLPAIGRPVANTQIYVLDRRRRPVPPGVPGEIFIAGENVARGYLHRPELTAERFVLDPFGAVANARMYRTGDLGRWQADGTLDYLGRGDDQVKLRGYRIEPGEIETQLARHPGVKEAAVVAREDVQGDKRLVAYVTLHCGQELSPAILRDHLLALLPAYMVPSAFVTLERLPLTPSGKLNRAALPAADFATEESTHAAPQGEIEALLAGIWQELLRLAAIGRDDNFFSLGGHSLLATRVMTRVDRELGLDLPLRVLFDHPTIRALGDHIATILAQELAPEAAV